ncbi:MAG: hypothetical protein KIG36_02545 [Eubacteriales bacterium]|nr:hypothetical protein [Eubacteriales bacterium]
MTVFFALKKSLDTAAEQVTLPEICKLASPDGDVAPLKNVRYPLRKQGVTVISGLRVAADILRTLPDARLVSLSETDSVVCKPYRHDKAAVLFGKAALTFLVLFFAAGTAIINFYADVDMNAAFSRLLNIAGGDALSIGAVTAIYCVGLLLGMLLFLGVPKKRSDPDPDTAAVESEKYDGDVEDYLRSKNE